jgi:hypothetical protein
MLSHSPGFLDTKISHPMIPTDYAKLRVLTFELLSVATDQQSTSDGTDVLAKPPCHINPSDVTDPHIAPLARNPTAFALTTRLGSFVTLTFS